MAEVTDTITNNSLIARIIANNLKPHFPAAVKNFIEQEWQTLLLNIAEQEGKDSEIWRETVRLLNNLSLYMEPTTRQQYPAIESRLLPDLIEVMRSTLLNAGITSQFIDELMSINTTTTNTPSEAVESKSKPATDTQQQDSTDNVLAFDIKPDDLPSSQVDDTISEVDRGNTIDFESFASQSETPVLSSSDVDLTEASPNMAPDSETLELDISEQDINEAQLTELEQELSDLAQQTNDDSISPEDLPPLELDLSDFEDDSSK